MNAEHHDEATWVDLVISRIKSEEYIEISQQVFFRMLLRMSDRFHVSEEELKAIAILAVNEVLYKQEAVR